MLSVTFLFLIPTTAVTHDLTVDHSSLSSARLEHRTSTSVSGGRGEKRATH